MLVFALYARNSVCFFLVKSEMFETETIDKICYFMEKNWDLKQACLSGLYLFQLSNLKLPDLEKM